jgi:hypothetical protein
MATKSQMQGIMLRWVFPSLLRSYNQKWIILHRTGCVANVKIEYICWIRGFNWKQKKITQFVGIVFYGIGTTKNKNQQGQELSQLLEITITESSQQSCQSGSMDAITVMISCSILFHTKLMSSKSYLFFIIILFLYWGYIVTFTKVLTVYHSGIHPLNPSFPHSWNSFNMSQFSIFIYEYIIFRPHLLSYTFS